MDKHDTEANKAAESDTPTPGGDDSEFARQMDVAEEVMRLRRNVLRLLAD